ncbi:MAG: transposase [Bacteroidota bacterium]
MNKTRLKVEQELRRQFGQIINDKQTERSLLLIQGILESKTVNLSDCAESLSRLPDVQKSQKQLYAMFIDHFQTGRYEQLLKCYFLVVFYLTFHLSDGRLVIDRTEWQIGNRWHNLLVLGYIIENDHKVFIPLVWLDLGQRKNSSTQERIFLMDRLRAWWKATNIPLPDLILYADREFIGSDWFDYLVKNKIGFVIRLRKNQKFRIWRNNQMMEKEYSTAILARYLKRYNLSEIEIISADEIVIPFRVTNNDAQQVLAPNKEQWLLAAMVEDPGNASTHYFDRWTIETAFGHTKSKGLNLEDFNLVGSHKIEIMLGIVSIVYALSVRQSFEEKLHEDVKIKTYKDGKQYPAKSIFKLGIERLRKIVRNVKELFKLILQIFNQVFEILEHKSYILNKSIVQ